MKGAININAAAINLLINLCWAFFISSSLSALIAFIKSNIPNTITATGTIYFTHLIMFAIQSINLSENPHDILAPEASVRVIRAHVAKGVLFAKENRLPEELKRAVEEHHGSMPIKVFYYKANRITEGTTLDISEYSYSGPIPTSKISAIIMIADASEAALRAQKSKEKAAAVIDSIVKDRLELGQFANCDITMNEIEIIKRTILTQYLSLEHDRITYPDGKK